MIIPVFTQDINIYVYEENIKTNTMRFVKVMERGLFFEETELILHSLIQYL